MKSLEAKGFFSVWNHHKCLIQVFPIHLNTYDMGLRPLWIFILLYFYLRDPHLSSESGIYRRQILTTKVDPRTVRVMSKDLSQFKLTDWLGLDHVLIVKTLFWLKSAGETWFWQLEKIIFKCIRNVIRSSSAVLCRSVTLCLELLFPFVNRVS